jgi:hypothetical protein
LLRPGPRGAMACNFLSLDNTDATARSTVNVLTEVGIAYRDLTFWNAIPWYGPREEKITSAMLERGSDMLGRLQHLLPNLEAVILLGRDAQRLERFISRTLALRVLKCALPSPFVWNQHRYRSLKEGIFDTFRIASAVVHNADGNEPSDVAGVTAEITTGSGAT